MTLRSIVCPFVTLLTVGCQSASTPSPPGGAVSANVVQTPPTLTSIRVGVAGNAEPVFEPGQSRQLWALGAYSDGSESDLTNRALWHSSNPVVATVSTGGLVSAAGFGAASINASFDGRLGDLGITVAPPTGCRLALSPERLAFGAFGSSGTVSVTARPSDCRWTVSSDSPWLPLRYDPRVSGSGTFAYTVPPNSTPAVRSASLVVAATGGATAIHAVEQERPRSCSYVVSPARSQFTRAGGTSSFQVDTTPDDCRWTTSIYDFYGSIVTGQSGTGDGRVVFAVKPTTTSVVGTVEVRGLSGENPPGVHTFEIR